MREVIEGIRLGRLDVESGETIWEDGGSDPGSVVIEALADGKIRISHGSREVLSTSCSDEMVRNNFRHDCHSVGCFKEWHAWAFVHECIMQHT
jgi:hypothetical protein